MPPLRRQKRSYSSTTNRFICINLTKLMLASWLKLLPSNDVQARVRSHACCFFARSRLFVPDKVHSLLSRNYIPAAVPLLVSPSVCVLQLGSHHNPWNGSIRKKNRRHTASNWHVSVAKLSLPPETVPRIHLPQMKMQNIKLETCSDRTSLVRVPLSGISTLNLFLSGVTIR